MPNRLPIPEELQILIEKREGTDRRAASRRAADKTEHASEATPAPIEGEQSSAEATTSRRKQPDRRKTPRRK